ncbi:hypothetical protein [Pseudomonas aeruginosa]|uniref:hypothetical protein n=1 Tax=Pseudomonas aeruginosa TaxID=287 RepID=UPI002E17DAB2|nr:hypothetical protein [Pseudomonas aeruginosa]
MQANQPLGGDTKASTATSATRTRPAMASKRLDLPSTCDICGNARSTGKHQRCSRARPRVGNVEAEWVCLGGIDVDPAGLRDFERLAGVPGTLLDLFTRDQYVRFHGAELLAEQGETFMLSNTPIWVRPVAVALSVAQQEVQQ